MKSNFAEQVLARNQDYQFLKVRSIQFLRYLVSLATNCKFHLYLLGNLQFDLLRHNAHKAKQLIS